jgi:hypothetical protein
MKGAPPLDRSVVTLFVVERSGARALSRVVNQFFIKEAERPRKSINVERTREGDHS